MGGEAGRTPSGGLRSCACSRTGWGRHHHHHHYDIYADVDDHYDIDDDDVDDDYYDIDDGDGNYYDVAVNMFFTKMGAMFTVYTCSH